MSENDNQNDTRVNSEVDQDKVDALQKWDQADAEIASRQSEIDMERSDLSEKWGKAVEEGDEEAAKMIEEKMWDLIKSRRKVIEEVLEKY